MPRERNIEYKPLSFSTTMRNPTRIIDFLKYILPYKGEILTNTLINKIAIDLIRNKQYQPVYITRTPRLKDTLQSDAKFSVKDAKEIMKHSPQNHKEAGFERGWPSRFDTWYKLPMEFGFLYYEMDTPIIISKTGQMLIDAHNEVPSNNLKIQNIFLNAMMKYQTNNPFRKNANQNKPLILLLQVIELLKNDTKENDAGIFRAELSLLICWPDSNAQAIYQKIKKIRSEYKYAYGDEVIYDICLKILNATVAQTKRFKLSQITGEAVDEFIRKMRITGIVSLRGNGRFLDSNSFESEKISYILANYSELRPYTTKKAYFTFMGTVDKKIIATTKANFKDINTIKLATLNEWARAYSKEHIINEIKITCSKTKSDNDVLRIIDKPTRLEFLTSIALKQHYKTLAIHPNYHIDDEGLPTCTASGGLADIECFEDGCNPLIEVTLMCARNQATNEMPAITRHLQEAIKKYPQATVFTLLIAPSIHTDTVYMAEFSKHHYNVNIITLTTKEFFDAIQNKSNLIDILEHYNGRILKTLL